MSVTKDPVSLASRIRCIVWVDTSIISSWQASYPEKAIVPSGGVVSRMIDCVYGDEKFPASS
jgi:hypothetical protein